MLLIGSQALKIRYPHLLDHDPKDVDIICTYNDFQDMVKSLDRKKIQGLYPIAEGKKQFLKYAGVIYEFEIAWEGTTADKLLDIELFGGVQQWGLDDKTGLPVVVRVPSLDVLFMLKSSHRFLKDSPHFLKTMRDYQKLKAAGAKIPDDWKDWYKAREKETYNYSHPSLNQSKANFFSGDGVKYIYDHDTIHLAMAIGPRPAYTYFKKPDADVLCDRGLFEAASFDIQMNSVMEETYVLALERSQIPFKDGKLPPEWSFKKALEKVCTSITSGWWRAWAYDHYDEAIKRYDSAYVDRFWAAVDSGLVKKL